jgi:ABC-type transporter Mla subunit MlaD
MAEQTDQAILKAIRGVGKNTSHLKSMAANAGSLFGLIKGSIGQLTALAPEMEKMGAKFSFGFAQWHKDSNSRIRHLQMTTTAMNLVAKKGLKFGKINTNLESNTKALIENDTVVKKWQNETASLAEKFSAPATVYDDFVFTLNSTRLNLNQNSKALRDLFSATMVTGENYSALAESILNVTAGMRSQDSATDNLADSLEEASQTFNRSREELAKSLSQLNASTKSLIAINAMGGTGLAEAVPMLRGLLPAGDQFNAVMQSINKLFTVEGLQKGFAAGFGMEGFERLAGADPGEALGQILRMMERSAELIRGDSLVSNIILSNGLQNIASVNEVAALNALKEMASTKLGIVNANELTSEQLGKAIMLSVKAQQQTERKFLQTFDMIKKDIVGPLINRALTFFMDFKKLFQEGEMALILQKILLAIGNLMFKAVMGIFNLVQKIAVGWLGDAALGRSMQEGMDAMKQVETNVKAAAAGIGQTNKLMDENNKKQASASSKLESALRRRSLVEVRQSRTMIESFREIIERLEDGNELRGEGNRLTGRLPQRLGKNVLHTDTPGGIHIKTPPGAGEGR